MGVSLAGKSAVITGAAAGIGRSAALAFAAAGARLVLADVNAEGGRETVRLVEAAGGEALFVQTDISEDAQAGAMVEAAVKAYGRLDCAFNNGAITGAIATIPNYSLEDWERTLRINLTGPFLCLRHEIPAMAASGGGAIVNTASGLGLVAQAGSSAYCAAKAGVLSLTRVAAVECAKRNIRVNAIAPGMIHTAMTAGLDDETRAFAANLHPIGRLGEPQEPAQAALWLCSDDASFVTGATLAVDGGYTAV